MTTPCFLCPTVGGQEELRQYWQKYMSKAILLVFVVDSANQQLLPLAKRHLHELLALDPHLPLLVVANKQVSVTAKTLHAVFKSRLLGSCPQPHRD